MTDRLRGVEQVGDVVRSKPAVARYQCPGCGRAVCSTGPVYTAGIGAKARTYVYLRQHNTPAGVRCNTATVRVITPRDDGASVVPVSGDQETTSG